MGHRWIITTVGEYMIKNPGRVIHLDELLNETKFTEPQIIAALNKWRNTRVPNRLQVVLPGKAWQYNETVPDTVDEPKPPVVGHVIRNYGPRDTTDGVVFERLGSTNTGDLILRDTNGTLYTAKTM